MIYIQDDPKAEQNTNLLLEVLNEKGWQNRFSKRGKAFFLFLDKWVKHVDKIVPVKEHTPWQDIPGYNTLMKDFLLELKSRDIKALPEALVETSISLLENEKLLNAFITIVYNKTKAHDSSNVFAVFDVIDSWLGAMYEYKRKIPSTFDYNFFLKGIYIILDGDHAINIAKVLWVLYNNINIFPGNFSI